MKIAFLLLALVMGTSATFAADRPAVDDLPHLEKAPLEKIPAACSQDALEALAGGQYIAFFPALVWYEDEPYFKTGEYGGFSAIGSYDPDVVNTPADNGGLALIKKHNLEGRDFWRVEYFAPFKGKCAWFGGTVLRHELAGLQFRNTLGHSVYDDAEIAPTITWE